MTFLVLLSDEIYPILCPFVVRRSSRCCCCSSRRCWISLRTYMKCLTTEDGTNFSIHWMGLPDRIVSYTWYISNNIHLACSPVTGPGRFLHLDFQIVVLSVSVGFSSRKFGRVDCDSIFNLTPIVVRRQFIFLFTS